MDQNKVTQTAEQTGKPALTLRLTFLFNPDKIKDSQCGINQLQLSISKIMKMVLGFWQIRRPVKPVGIKGENAQMFLFLQRFRSSSVNRRLLGLLSLSVVASIVFSVVIYWGIGVTAADTKGLKLFRRASIITRVTVDSLEVQKEEDGRKNVENLEQFYPSRP
ncbi:hypothetical protein MHYP_G00359970 [Metynnis hypsauchen]